MAWLHKRRAVFLAGVIIAAVFILYYISFVRIAWNFNTLTTCTGIPLAADYANYWAAAKLALSDNTDLIYDIEKLHDIQYQFFGVTHFYGCGWYYPPVFLLIVLPFGLMPYLWSFSMWIGITFLLFMYVLYNIKIPPIGLIFMFTFPGIFENFIFGQNAYLTGTLIGGGLLLLDKMPLAAGILFGLLSYKPNFFPLILLALLIGSYWRALLSTIISSVCILLVTVIIFGYQIWIDYFHIMKVPMDLLEKGLAAWNLMPTFFAAILSLGCHVKTAYLVQGVVMLIVLLGVGWTWRKDSGLALRGSILCLGVLLFTPYAFIYDLAILALPLGWLWQEGSESGRLPGELILLALGWVMPIAVPLVWGNIHIFQGRLQIGPLVLLALFLLALIKQKSVRAEKYYENSIIET